MANAFYTVLWDRIGYPVKYLDPENAYRIKTLKGPFSTSEQAVQAFQAHVKTHTLFQVNERTFQGKARAFAKMRRKQEQKLSV